VSGLVTLLVPGSLQPFLPARRRRERVGAAVDGTSTIGHLVQSVGVPLTEVGELLRCDDEGDAAAGEPLDVEARPRAGEVIRMVEIGRPQPTPSAPPRFLLDVHLGTLARRMRLLGLDTAYRNQAADDELTRWALAESRMLLTRDRGLLRRRALRRHAAFVRGDDPDLQLHDVLDRFDPLRRPWTRCPACNGLLAPVAKAEVDSVLLPGTRRCYDEFVRCTGCGAVYWPGAHRHRLQNVIDAAPGAATEHDRGGPTR
jgi:uncharacterized protein with PIN domain